MRAEDEADIAALIDAVAQCLDDMGVDGRCVCEAAKAKLRVAFEPFRTGDHAIEYPLEDAKFVLMQIEQ